MMQVSEFMKKIRSKKGETIAETLVAMMIVAMSLTILAGAIVSAAKVNSKVKNAEVSFINDGGDGEIISTKAVLKIGDVEKASFDVYAFNTGNGYYYYEK